MKWVYLTLTLQILFTVCVVYTALRNEWLAMVFACLIWVVATFAHGFVQAARRDGWLL